MLGLPSPENCYFDVPLADLYYWFTVGEATLPLHHLISRYTPNEYP
jgi:hypothetical protein